ncbi:hypothetical protein A5821_001454 [Enterococcus sp. 7F3_DIV0205]|uniref:Uncharacterized protein n=1 Tax=Candidatus Enterococcus palustris TaxID=1834189 RepID=A0AAQ3W7V7_9ENTE|nr:hypothetical protein [Enterococcus sp. 7F3_DIV0205]OTN85850.1 hypothetical protein A5821_001798 [Enterococcus sp. 7F3_DIV0205]
MKKKMISGLLVISCLGALGFAAVSEAVGSMENSRMNSFEMRHRDRRYRESRNDEEVELEKKTNYDEVTKDETKEIQTNREEVKDYSYNRRESRNRNHMSGMRQRQHDRMNNSCW